MKSNIAIVFLCCLAIAHANPVARVVGGGDAPEGKYPYQVSIRYGPMFLCGGSILNKHYILTAAHCVYKRNPQMITISTGTNDFRGSEGQFYFASKLIPHENFSSLDIEDISDDIALIRVDKEIVFNEKVRPIDLPTKDVDTYSGPATLTGWGRLGVSETTPKTLQEIQLTVIDQESCRAAWRQLQESHICTLTKVGEGACSGDSGGPLVYDGRQIGIVSFGKACALGIPDVFTRVYSYLDWINEHMTA